MKMLSRPESRIFRVGDECLNKCALNILLKDWIAIL